ncbi:MAG: acyltransferase [Novosphingobium sp.]|nr:acyltransferase [Novosphingobium sp.]
MEHRPISLNTGVGHRFVALDSLRGICAIVVALYHFQTTGWLHNNAMVSHGFLFVDFFFVLSGFVIAGSYRSRLASRQTRIAQFMTLRLGRVYPLHLFVLVLFVAFRLVSIAGFGVPFGPGEEPTRPSEIGSLLATIPLVQIFWFDVALVRWNGPSWSIAAELWSYLIFAVILRFAGPRINLVVGTIALAAGAYLTLAFSGIDNMTLGVPMVRCLYSFPLGVLAFAALARARRFAISWSPAVATGAELMVSAAAIAAVALGMSLLAPLIFACAVLVFSLERGAPSAFLRRPSFVWLGAISYSIYMAHLFVQHRILNVLAVAEKMFGGPHSLLFSRGDETVVGPNPWWGDAASILMVGLVIGASYCTYRFVEQPGRAWSRRIARGDSR